MLLIDDRASVRHAAAMLVAAQTELNGLRAQEQEQRDSVVAAAAARLLEPRPQPAARGGACRPASSSATSKRACARLASPQPLAGKQSILRQSHAQEMCERGLDDLLGPAVGPDSAALLSGADQELHRELLTPRLGARAPATRPRAASCGDGDGDAEMLVVPGLEEDDELIEQLSDAQGPGAETRARKRRQRSPTGGPTSDVDFALPDDPAIAETLAPVAPASHIAASVAAADAAARATAVDEEVAAGESLESLG